MNEKNIILVLAAGAALSGIPSLLASDLTVQGDVTVEGDTVLEQSLDVEGIDGVLFRGTFGQGEKPLPDYDWQDPDPDVHGPRFMWYPRRGAFRAGATTNLMEDAWNDSSIGHSSTAFGSDNYASGWAAFAIGAENFASGQQSLAMGWGTYAGGAQSFAGGDWASATATNAFSFGFNTLAAAENSAAFGYQTQSNEPNAFAAGYQTRVNAEDGAAFGRYNIGPAGNPALAEFDAVFEIGNGTGPSDRSNAFAVYRNGRTEVAGDLVVAGSATIEHIEPQGDIGMGKFGSD